MALNWKTGGGWEVDAGEGGEKKMACSWLGRDRLAVVGLRSDGKKPNLLQTRYPQATSVVSMCEDGLTELSALSGFIQTVRYDKFGQIQRISVPIGAKNDRLTLGTKVWKSTYDATCSRGPFLYSLEVNIFYTSVHYIY